MWLGWLGQTALACGGFFCTPAIAPIDQAAEEIVFAFDEAAGEVEMHVEVTWSGESEDFAWILPVPAEPELFLSEQELFADLAFVSSPRFFPTFDTEGRCGPIRVSIGCAEYTLASAAPGSLGSVTVVDTDQIGPYETTTLLANSSDALLTWLADHDYDLPPSLGPKLDPYVAEGSHFVAMRLSATADTGDIEPIGLRYPADHMAIPIQLTAIAAAPDMPVRVYVFADHRAVPESYLDVEINEAAIDWIGRGQNYPEVLAAAVDAAGGQAFVTEYAQRPPEALQSAVYSQLRSRFRTGTLTRMTTALSPAEMTVDPTFVLRPDLPDVDNVHTADGLVDCRGGGDNDAAPTSVTLRDGREVLLGEIDFGAADSERAIRDLQDVPALAVRDLVTGELLVDYTDDAQAALDAHNERIEQELGCGCDTARLSGSLAGGLLVLVAAARRRES